jgi:type IV secretory pathway TrbF-like protein
MAKSKAITQDKNKESQKNTFLNQIDEDGWNDIQAYHIENASVWRKLAVMAIVSQLIVAIICMYLVNQDKHKVLVFEKNSTGNLQILGVATKTINADNRIIAHQLDTFIIALREVPLDVNVKRRNIDIVHKMTDPKIRSQVDKLIIDQYTKAKTDVINVDVQNVKPIEGGKSWEVIWTERVPNNSPNSSSEPITHWSAIVTYKKLDVTDPATQIINPVGLFITYINPSQDINDKGN